MDRDEELKCSPLTEGGVLNEREVNVVWHLRARGWCMKAIARELGITRNTVRRWVRRGQDAARPVLGRPRVLEAHEAWGGTVRAT